jgi:hypothetical protein
MPCEATINDLFEGWENLGLGTDAHRHFAEVMARFPGGSRPGPPHSSLPPFSVPTSLHSTTLDPTHPTSPYSTPFNSTPLNPFLAPTLLCAAAAPC